MNYLNKSNYLSCAESRNQTWGVGVEKVIKKVWVQNVPSTVKAGRSSAP